MDLPQLLSQPESEWLDFKQQYHDNKASLLHDILWLANAYAESDRFLVFGVTDDRQTHGVAADTHRLTNANLQDLLRAVNLNRIPTCTLRLHDYNGAAIDVLTIETTGQAILREARLMREPIRVRDEERKYALPSRQRRGRCSLPIAPVHRNHRK